MKKIPLTNRNDKFLLVSDEDYEKMAKYKWYLASTGYAMRLEKDAKTGKWKHINAQKDICPNQRVYFKDGDRLNCQRENLRTRSGDLV